MEQKTVVLGVTGCIAAYKSCAIVREFQRAGYRVKVVMTEHATHFVDPTTFRALTHEKVAIGLFDDPSDPIHHISLAEEADLFLIAPCTANVMAKIAHGIADDLLSTAALATTAPLALAPAMNVHMYEAQATQANMALLRSRGVHFIEPDSGYLACGYVGPGRMPEPADVVAFAIGILEGKKDLAGRKVMITAGPTRERIDPVRYISNDSSGKMGFALAEAARDRGAEVTLVSGPVALENPAGVRVLKIESARELLEACREPFAESDAAIFAAAVADKRPERIADAKLKKGRDDDMLENIKLVDNPDVLATLASVKGSRVVVGFAAETNDVLDNARRKLEKKGADFIVANEVGHGKAFGTPDNEVWFVSADGEEHVPAASKRQISDAILDQVVKRLSQR
ncbi:MAG: bifunctional phosphopantothenoylcysteine decarboxylase/phosphopantothenate--cysteine ligase CoaBC [Coriobacteriaceae bacterium]|nr:bifunctional phosphopantothenoylcysteine decarboxylase/phosphopantothenate--cysteine ligase CoaBC [Coriobacteriaceae bacterium]